MFTSKRRRNGVRKGSSVIPFAYREAATWKERNFPKSCGRGERRRLSGASCDNKKDPEEDLMCATRRLLVSKRQQRQAAHAAGAPLQRIGPAEGQGARWGISVRTSALGHHSQDRESSVNGCLTGRKLVHLPLRDQAARNNWMKRARRASAEDYPMGLGDGSTFKAEK